MPKQLKICVAASAGGHLTQALRISAAWNDCDAVYVSTTPVVRDRLQALGKVYIVGECNRNSPFKTLAVFFRCVRIIAAERPDVVISTGAAAGCMLCWLGKLSGARIVWCDSITNVDRLSLSGRLVRHIADLFLVQWPQLARKYRNAEYAGDII